VKAIKPSRLRSNVTDIAVRAQERRARKLMLQGDLAGATAVYREILTLAPDDANAHYQLGICHRHMRRWEEAAAALQRAIELGDDRAASLMAEVRAALPGIGISNVMVEPIKEDQPAVVVGSQVMTRTSPDDALAALWPGDPLPVAPRPQAVRPSPVIIHGHSHPAEDEEREEIARRPIICPPLDDIFALGGPLAASLGPRYRPRLGQVKMANLIRDALQGRKHAVIEAGTGIGKSFAYLIPILWSGTPAIVSTSNKGLMNQLWEKDIPRLQQIAPSPVKATLLKGRGNYLCNLRLDKLRQQIGRPERRLELALIHQGLERIPDGDMERMGLPPSLTAQLTVSNRECKGRRCPRFESCFYEKAKREALKADLVVTNHAMLCYNALLAENHILPVRPVLIIDEAHQLTRYAIDALTMALERELFWSFINGPTVRPAVDDPNLLLDVRTAYDSFFRTAERQRPRVARSGRRPTRWELTGEIQSGLALGDALAELQRVLSHASNLDEADQESALLQVEELATTVHALATPEPETHIRLCEVERESTNGSQESYHALYRPLGVESPLRRLLFEAWPRVICTSASLGVGQDLGWFKRQVGLFETEADRPVIAETLRSPFDYANQMMLYTPRTLTPVYNEKQQAFATDYVDRLTEEVQRLLEASQGRALVLCTSRARMRQLHDTLASGLRPRYPCYLQGEYAQPELVARFKEDGNAILFATRGYWEGLDIPGDALALVILDKIPFVPYDDPVIRRQEAQIRARGGNTFYEVQLAPAILNLRQGAGRLIRSETDRGVIALLDARLLSKSYGRQIIRSLPEGCHTTDFGEVAAFLRPT